GGTRRQPGSNAEPGGYCFSRSLEVASPRSCERCDPSFRLEKLGQTTHHPDEVAFQLAGRRSPRAQHVLVCSIIQRLPGEPWCLVREHRLFGLHNQRDVSCWLQSWFDRPLFPLENCDFTLP